MFSRASIVPVSSGGVRAARIFRRTARAAGRGRRHPPGSGRRGGTGPGRPGRGRRRRVHHAGPSVSARRAAVRGPARGPDRLGPPGSRAGDRGRLRRGVPLRRPRAARAAQHDRRPGRRGLPGHRVEDPVPRAPGGLDDRAARPAPAGPRRARAYRRADQRAGRGRAGPLHRLRAPGLSPGPGGADLRGSAAGAARGTALDGAGPPATDPRRPRNTGGWFEARRRGHSGIRC